MQPEQQQVAFASLPAGRTAVRVAYDPGAGDDFTRDVGRGVNPTAWLTDLLIRFARPGSLILDLGANIGCFTMTAAALGYRVLAVEAAPHNAHLLREGVRANRFGSVEVVHAAVTDVPRELRFFVYGPYGYVDLHGKNEATVAVPGVPVDDLLAGRGSPPVGFVKLDIEGSEVAGVRGMARLLAGADAPPLVFESNKDTLGLFRTAPAELFAEVARHGYHLYTVRDGFFRRFVPRRPDDPQAEVLIDCLAVKRPLGWVRRHDWGRLPAGLAGRLGLRRGRA